MNIVDIIIIIGIILGALTGFHRGFFKQTVVFIGTILVIVIAFVLKNPLSIVMYQNLPFFKLWGLTSLNILLYEVLAFIIAVSILSIVFAILIKITGIIEGVLKATVILALPSKLLGLLVGIIESIVILYVILLVVSLPVFKAPYINESKYTKLILTKTPVMSGIAEKLVTSFNEVKDSIIYVGTDIKDVKGTNTKIVEVLLKNKITTTDSIKLLADNNKIEINDLEGLLEKYKEVSVDNS